MIPRVHITNLDDSYIEAERKNIDEEGGKALAMNKEIVPFAA